MAAVPCICQNAECRTIYFVEVSARFKDKPGTISIPEGQQIGFGNCPDCNSVGYVPPGRYALDYVDNDTDNPARLIAGPLSTKTIIEQAHILIDVLKQSKRQKQSEVIAALESVSPVIANISRKTADKVPYLEWISTISTLLTFFILIQQTYFKKTDKPEVSGIKPEYVEMLIKENTERREKEKVQVILRKVSRPRPQQTQHTPAQNGNNKPCPCGSGRKFKHCHGRTRAGT